jgi:hypothetical protein
MNSEKENIFGGKKEKTRNEKPSSSDRGEVCPEIFIDFFFWDFEFSSFRHLYFVFLILFD